MLLGQMCKPRAVEGRLAIEVTRSSKGRAGSWLLPVQLQSPCLDYCDLVYVCTHIY